tara:strand:- start:763 stop:1959 length:1197 start_codon:yes stop_codon:yes gene_type:complete
MRISTAGSERVRIDSSGRVGIGTSSPATKLAVSGSIAGTAALNISGLGWGIQPYVANSTLIDNNSGDTRFFAVGANNSTYGTYIFYQGTTSGATNERMRINSSGNMILGGTTAITTSGQTSLTIGNGSANPAITLYSATNNQGQISFGDATSGTGAYEGYIYYHHNTNVMGFGTNHAERMRIHSAGRIGIGTSGNTIQGSLVIKDVVDHNGSDVFVVAQNGNASRQAGYKVFDEGGTSSLEMKYDNGSNFARISNPNNGQLSINLGGTGSANMLDDYEEGTHTFVEISGQAPITNNRVHYTKIGRLVTVQASISVGSTTNTNVLNLSLPFSSSINGYYLGGGNISYTNISNTYASNNMRPNIENAANNVFFIYNNATHVTCANASGTRIDFSISYYTE